MRVKPRAICLPALGDSVLECCIFLLSSSHQPSPGLSLRDIPEVSIRQVDRVVLCCVAAAGPCGCGRFFPNTESPRRVSGPSGGLVSESWRAAAPVSRI